MRGIRTIENAVSVFEKVRKGLALGIEQCNEGISREDEVISHANQGKRALQSSLSQAERVIKKLDEIVA